MKKILKIQILFLIFVFSSCTQKKLSGSEKVGEIEKTIPKADIAELETEINNGGFNQYFINSSGQNCYETLKTLKKNGKLKTAKLLEKAIILINPNKISEKVFIEKLSKNEVDELYNEKISVELEKLDAEFYKYLDGNLTEK